MGGSGESSKNSTEGRAGSQPWTQDCRGDRTGLPGHLCLRPSMELTVLPLAEAQCEAYTPAISVLEASWINP